MKPNFYTCQECPYWDDINGCWRDCKQVCCADMLDEEGLLSEEDEDE